MKSRIVVPFFALLCLVASGPSYARSEDVVSLQRRIAELERQNKQIMETLSELSGKLDRKQAVAETVETVKAPAAVLTEGNKSALSFYGFARLDMIFDDSQPSAQQTPTFILSEPASTRNNGTFALHPRLSRLGMNYKGPEIEMLGGARISAKVETDFQNGGRESRAIARYRHVYAKLDWEHSSLLLGQTWDIISPLYPAVNADTMMWNAGNLGDRRVQVRYTYTPDSGFSLAAGIALTGAINSQDLDGNGIRDGEDSGLPQFQGRAGYKSEFFDLGFWGHYANEKTQTPFNGKTDFDSYSLGADFAVRPFDRVSMKGEFWTGSGLGDMRGGIGQSINTTTGREIASNGGWLELGFRATSMYTVTGGWTVDDPRNNDLSAGGRKLNRVWYMTNQLQLHPSFKIGLDYLHWTTDYIDLPRGTDNRLNLYTVYTF